MRKAKLLLTLAMAAAVVSTAAVSFAQWDTLSATATGTVTLTKPIVVTASKDETYSVASKDANTGVSTYSGEVTIAAADVPASQKDTTQLELTPKVSDGSTDVTSNFTVTVEKDGATAGTVTATGNTTTDAAPDLTGANNTYTVKLVPNDDDATKALAGRALNVEVEAKLTTK